MDYRGRSLLYIRTLLECPPRWMSAKHAAEALSEQIRTDYPIVVGAVCFYEMEPWGDVGLYVGSGEVLRLVQGVPVLVNLIRDLDYLGWVSTQAFRDTSHADVPVVS